MWRRVFLSAFRTGLQVNCCSIAPREQINIRGRLLSSFFTGSLSSGVETQKLVTHLGKQPNSVLPIINNQWTTLYGKTTILQSSLCPALLQFSRSLIKFSLRKGKRKTVKAVVKRFYRLQSGVWIRTRAGKNRKLYKKSPRRKYRIRQHVFCNKTQSIMLDKMVTKYWKKPKYYIDDIYEPYHVCHNFPYVPRIR
ncbi:39S ribosomal protein L35, mitochondrial-like [Limulus polyphemus]|uniref:Large ribosomal subunit protein bL35m n=1 Tax=Limulus polyphemus TaxID=6850 RepID=A0ABM1BYH8_LIMPO|nr:39S ribosomal protein L35, mitochondrial-like [Limulus polyphemus]XP_013791088.1 39S ribosomal protein L35, mitochondrial-like [Limulus polyphemus]